MRPPAAPRATFGSARNPRAFGHNPTPPLGWTAGAGVEYLFTDAVSVKLEYLYVNLGTVSCPAGILCSSDNKRASKYHQDHPERLSVFHRKPDPRRHQLQVQLVILQAAPSARNTGRQRHSGIGKGLPA